MKKIFLIVLEVYKYIILTIIAVSLLIIAINLLKFTKCIVPPAPNSKSDVSCIKIGGDVETGIVGRVSTNTDVSGSISADVCIDSY